MKFQVINEEEDVKVIGEVMDIILGQAADCISLLAMLTAFPTLLSFFFILIRFAAFNKNWEEEGVREEKDRYPYAWKQRT